MWPDHRRASISNSAVVLFVVMAASALAPLRSGRAQSTPRGEPAPVSKAVASEIARISKSNATGLTYRAAEELLLSLYSAGPPADGDMGFLRDFLRATPDMNPFRRGEVTLFLTMTARARATLSYGLPENVSTFPDASIREALISGRPGIPMVLARQGESSNARLGSLWRAEADTLIAKGGDFAELSDHITKWVTLAPADVQVILRQIFVDALTGANLGAARPAPAGIMDRVIAKK